ncbi:MAG: acyl-CoA dehydrogenase family protein [Xanthobacteraceae bacterium]
MPVATIRSTKPKPTPAELLSRAREIGALARARAQQTENDRQVSAEMIERMREADLFRTMQPAAYGGFEYGFEVLVDVTSAIGAGCGSTGWVACFGIVHQWLAASFSKPAQDEFWADPGAIAAGSYAPVGKVVPVEGGYRISGLWSFLSGCDNAQWFFVGGMIPPGGASGPPTAAFFMIPRSDANIEDNWHTMGLAGTGSKNAAANDLFVPAHRMVTFPDLLTGNAPGGRVHANPLYRNPLLALLPYSLLAPILGIAEGALADFLDMAKVRATRGAVAGGNNRMAEFATIQMRVAEAQGSVDAARMMMLQDIDATCAVTARGEKVSLDMRLRNRLHQAFCAKLLVQAVDALFAATGGQGIFDDKPIQRAWRDAHAAATHVSLNWDAVSTMYGQYALGLEPKGQY